MKYSKEGLYILKDGGRYQIGLSDKGQDDVGDVIYADVKVDDTIKKGDPLISVEGGKAVSDISSPLSGKVVDVHDKLSDFPERLNSDVTSRNWIVVLEEVEESEYQALDDESGFNPDSDL